jgi:hypothetical protein
MHRSRYSAMNDRPIIAFEPDDIDADMAQDAGQACLWALNFRPWDHASSGVRMASYLHDDLAAFFEATAH